MQPMFTILYSHIDHGVYMSANHVSHDLDLIFMVYWSWLKFMLSFCDLVILSIAIHLGSP